MRTRSPLSALIIRILLFKYVSRREQLLLHLVFQSRMINRITIRHGRASRVHSETFPKSSKSRHRSAGSTVVLSCCDLSVWKMAVGDPGPLRYNKTEALRRASKPGQIRGRFSDNFIAASRRIKLSFEGVSEPRAYLLGRRSAPGRNTVFIARRFLAPSPSLASERASERVYVRRVCVKPVEWHCVSRYL